MMILEQIKSLFRILKHQNNKKNRFYAIGKILWWKINQKFFHFPAIVEIDNQIKCICYPTSSYGGLIVYCKLPEYPEMMFVKKILTSNSIFFDVGANIGAFTLVASSVISDGKIYSFEPTPSVLEILYQNIKINKLEERVKVIEKVVSNKNGKEEFAIENVSEYSHISSNNSKGVSIPSIRLEDFCKKEKVSSIDIIKIDIEGAALLALKGLEEYLKARKVKTLIVELSGDSVMYGSTSQQVIDYLKQFGYLTFKLNNDLAMEEIRKVNVDEILNIIACRENDLTNIKRALKN